MAFGTAPQPARRGTAVLTGSDRLLVTLLAWVLAGGIAHADFTKTVSYAAAGAATETLTVRVSGLDNPYTRSSASPNVFAFMADFPPYGTSITVTAEITPANPWQQTDTAGGAHSLSIEMFDDSGTKVRGEDAFDCPPRIYTPPGDPAVVQPCPPQGHDPTTMSATVTFHYEPPEGLPVIYVRYDALAPALEAGPAPTVIFAVQIDATSSLDVELRGDPDDQPNHFMLTTSWTDPPPPPVPPPPPDPQVVGRDDDPPADASRDAGDPGDGDDNGDDADNSPDNPSNPGGGGGCSHPNGCPAPDGHDTCGYGQGLPGFWVDTSTLSPVVRDTDYQQSAPGPTFTMTRTYSVIPGASKMFGRNWSFTYESQVQSYCSSAAVWTGTGRVVVFKRPQACTSSSTYPLVYMPPAGVFDQLTEHVEGSTRYFRFVEKRTGNVHRFDRFATAFRLTSITDRNGMAVHVTLNASETIAAVSDAAGHTVQFQYDGNGRCTSMSTPDGRQATYSYNAAGRLVSTVDLMGTAAAFEYDEGGWLTRIAVGGRANTFTYGTRKTCQDCPTTKYVAGFTDMAGRPTTIQLLFSIGWQTDLLIRSAAGVTSVLRLFNGLPDTAYNSVTQASPVKYSWDATGRLLTSVVGADGLVTSLQYDARGNVVRREHPGTGALTFTWDANDRMTSRGDALGRTWSYVNDGAGRLVRVTTPGGRVTEYGRNAAGQVTSVNRSGAIWRLARDGAGQVTSVTDPLGHVATLAYDVVGNVEQIVEPGGATTSVAYDANRRPVLATLHTGATRRMEYDACAANAATDERGNRATVTRDLSLLPLTSADAEGRTIAYGHNGSHQLTSLSTGGDTVAFGYDEVGRPRSVSRNSVDGYSVTRDAAGHVTSIVDSQGHATGIAYDAVGNVRQLTDPDGRTLGFTHDALGRLRSVVNGRGTSIGREWTVDGSLGKVTAGGATVAEFTRDVRGRLLSVTDATGTTTWTRDAMGRVVGIRAPTGQSAGFGLDARGRIASIDYPGGFTVTYTYDLSGRPVRAAFPGGTIDISYDAAGRVLRQIRSNGAETLHTYDKSGLLVRIEHLSGGAAFARLRFQRDASGRIQEQVAALPDAPLVRALGDSGLVTFGKTNQVLTAGGNGYTYDADGNVVAIGGARGFSASYDAENQLVSMTAGGRTSESQYDGLGRRTIVTEGGVTRRFAFAPGGQLLWESDAGGTVLARHVYVGQTLVATAFADGQVSFHHLDHRFSVIASTDRAGTAINAYRYGPFGEVTHRRESVPQRFTFLGGLGVVDEGNDLFLMTARHYDASTGHFLQKDPAGFAGGANLYVYALGDPVNLIDPGGMQVPPQYSQDNRSLKCLVVMVDGGKTLALVAAAMTGGPVLTVGAGLLAADKLISMMRYAGGKTEQGYDSAGGFLWDVLNPGGDGLSALLGALKPATASSAGSLPHGRSPLEDPHFPSYGKYTIHP